MKNTELQWATKVAAILNETATDFEAEISRLEYSWKVQQKAREILALPVAEQKSAGHALEMWFGLDVHRAMNNSFDGVALGDKRIAEERKKGWSTD
jgi:hypothetical protein